VKTKHLFLKNKAGQIPSDINWSLLHNVTINLANEEVKLYFFNSSLDYLFKFSNTGRNRQYGVLRNGLDLYPLSKFFGHSINLDDVIVDTLDLENGVYFLSIKNTSLTQYIWLFKYLLDKYHIENQFFYDKINDLNGTSISTMEECHSSKCIDVIRLSINEHQFKVYARTFRYHHFDIPKKTQDFLTQALNCSTDKLIDKLESGGMSYDFSNGRTQLFTQEEKVKSLRN